MMLSAWYDEDEETDELNSIAEEYNVEILGDVKGDYINSSVVLSKNGYNVCLSEFPGNCSSLVISCIQNRTSAPPISDIMKASIKLAEHMQYGAIFASGTDIDFRDWLANLGFEVITAGLYNPHSGSDNFFMMKVLKYDV